MPSGSLAMLKEVKVVKVSAQHGGVAR